jgi:hypothetical protein
MSRFIYRSRLMYIRHVSEQWMFSPTVVVVLQYDAVASHTVERKETQNIRGLRGKPRDQTFFLIFF